MLLPTVLNWTFLPVAFGVHGSKERLVFSVRVFNPHAPSNKQSPLLAVYAKHEREKKRAYMANV